MEKLLNMLAMNKGMIVSSSQCSRLEIAQASACGRMYVDGTGLGFIYLPPQNITGS